MTTADKIVEAFTKNDLKNNPFDSIVPLIKNERDQALPLALLIVDRIPEGGTFFDFLLSHLTEKEFKALLDVAIEKLRKGKSNVLDSVVAYASVQFAHLLTPFLDALFELNPNSGAYYALWPWRAADDAHIEALKEIIKNSQDEQKRNRAWQCLIETRRSECITFADEHIPVALELAGGMEPYVNGVGFDISVYPPHRLYKNQCYHIIFPADYFAGQDRPAWNARANHPTWSLEGTESFPGSFGGEAAERCCFCGGPLHTLLQVEDAGPMLNASLPRIEFCTCLSCLGWEEGVLFYCHDSQGKPSPSCTGGERFEPDIAAEQLKATPVRYVRSPSRWEFQDWGLSNGRENLNRVGGEPSWIQDSHYPACPQCGDLMHFVAQLDSDLPTVGNDGWLWGSGGICYLFWCDRCAMSANLWQCT